MSTKKTERQPARRPLIIGSGAREHAITAALARSPSQPTVHFFGSSVNPGIRSLCTASGGSFHTGSVTDTAEVRAAAGETQADLVVIGPEAPLEAGAADVLREAGMPVLGPDRDLARIETSKSFARELMQEVIPEACPAYRVIRTLEEADTMLKRLGADYVVKADGLTGGKGVKVAGEHLHSHSEALDYCRMLLADPGTGGICVVEEKLEGEEFSLMTLTDGETCIHLPAVQDHKRAWNGDQGPNTGGMGSWSDADGSLPFLDAEDVKTAAAMNEQIIQALGRRFSRPYRGVLYGGFMAVSSGVKVIEYNARFGDPESLNILTLLVSDAALLFTAAASGWLEPWMAAFSPLASVCKYVVPEGYPENPLKHKPINCGSVGRTPGPEETETLALYLGSVDLWNDVLVTSGSRTAAVVAAAPTLAAAEQRAEAAVTAIRGPLFHRSDIGTESQVHRRIEHMSRIRGQRYSGEHG